MSTYQMRSDDGEGNVQTSGDYTTYDGPDVGDGPDVKGFNLLTSAAEKVGRFIETTISEDGDDVSFEKATSRTARYAGAGVRSIYITHAEVPGAEQNDDGEWEFPDSLGLTVAPSDESEFEEAADEEEAAENLLADAESDDSVEVEEADDSDEPSEEEEADELLDEMAEAGE